MQMILQKGFSLISRVLLPIQAYFYRSTLTFSHRTNTTINQNESTMIYLSIFRHSSAIFGSDKLCYFACKLLDLCKSKEIVPLIGTMVVDKHMKVKYKNYNRYAHMSYSAHDS